MYKIDRQSVIELGVQGEAKRKIEIDASAWLKQKPGMDIEIMLKRPGEDDPFPVAAVTDADGIVTFETDLAITEYEGFGELQVRGYTADGAKWKTVVLTTHVLPGMDGTEQEDPPEKAQGWVDYVIDNIIRIRSEGNYLKPEQFGAVGDGKADDTLALNACIAQAQETKQGVLAGGVYKTTGTVFIHTKEVGIRINKIAYTGSEHAVEIASTFSGIEIHQIDATKNGTGVRLTTIAEDVPGLEMNCSCNTIKINDLRAKKNALEIVNPNSNRAIYYNRLDINYLRSNEQNCIYASGQNLAEIDIAGKETRAKKGYFYYAEDGCSLRPRVHEYGLEDKVMYGFRGNAVLINCRVLELQDTLGTGSAADGTEKMGSLFIWDGIVPNSKAIGCDQVDIKALDVSNAKTYQQVLEDVKSRFDRGLTGSTAWSVLRNRRVCEFDGCIRYRNANGRPSVQQQVMPGKIYVYFNHVAYKPDHEWLHVVDVPEFRMRPSETRDYYIAPTVFEIAENTDIYLDDSYCAVAINKITIIQKGGKKCRVYDKNGSMIFDGTELSNNVYELMCTRTRADVVVVDSAGVQHAAGVEYLAHVYTGENEEWKRVGNRLDAGDGIEYKNGKVQVQYNKAGGLELNSSGDLRIAPAVEKDIRERKAYAPIDAARIDYAVETVLKDTDRPYSEATQEQVQEKIGLGGVKTAISQLKNVAWNRAEPSNLSIIALNNVYDVIGIPQYLTAEMARQYTGKSDAESGWYWFGSLHAPDGVTIKSNGFSFTGSNNAIIGMLPKDGDTSIFIAIRFDANGTSVGFSVNWDGKIGNYERYVFRCTDLAIRNLDYKTTYYVYDLAPYADVTDEKVTFSGMTHNVTYQYKEKLSKPIEIVLPDVEDDDGHGVWMELQLYFTGTFSCTLVPPQGVTVKNGPTPTISAGYNVLDLMYYNIDGVKCWRVQNTKSSF